MQLGPFDQIVVGRHNLDLAYQAEWSLLEVATRYLGHPLTPEFEPIVAIEVHCRSIGHMELAVPASNVEVQVEVVVVDVGDIDLTHPRWQFEVAEVVQWTCAEDNTYLEGRDSCSGMAPGCKSMLGLMVEYCKIPGGEKQVDHC